MELRNILLRWENTVVVKALKIIVVSAVSTLWIGNVAADSFLEIGVGAGQYQLDGSEKTGIRFADDFTATEVSLGAYRVAGKKSAWGAVIEYAEAGSRDIEFGSGNIVGFRPVNYLYMWSDRLELEFFAGAAQYDGERTATGYYLGGNARFNIPKTSLAASLGVKYFQDLNYDTGAGDLIVDGPAFNAKLFYRF